jgi:hypothetical protein
MRAVAVLRLCFAMSVWLCLTGCDRRSEQAVVLSKEHIAAAPAAATGSATPHTDDGAADNEVLQLLAEDEITVDSYVMKRADRGTSRDPRALEDEQWLVKVRTMATGRTFNVPADRPRYHDLRQGDHVQVKYGVGKYTGTVWGAELVQK